MSSSIDEFFANLDVPELHILTGTTAEDLGTSNTSGATDTNNVSDTINTSGPTDTSNTSHIFTGSEPISSYSVIDTVLDNAILPEPFRVEFTPKSTYRHNIYNDSKKLIEELESRMSGTKFSLNPDPNDRNNIFGERNITKFVNDQLAMRLLQISFKYMEINGENKTLRHLLDHMKPFDGSLSQVLADKEMVIKKLRTELDLYKLKTEQTQKQMRELRQVYEERRKQEFNKYKEHIIKGRDAIKENIKLEEKIKKYKKQNREKYNTIRRLKRSNASYQNVIDYQRNRKIQARRKYNELLKSTQKQLHKLVNENERYETQVKNIENRMVHLSKSRFPALNKHFVDLFPKEDIVGDCSYCCDPICRSDMFVCSNEKCGIVSHKKCVLCIPGSTCQFCQTSDPNLEILHSEHEEKPGIDDEFSRSMAYDSDNDEDFNYDELRSLHFSENESENHTDEDNIRYRTIDEFQAAMFNPNGDEDVQEETEPGEEPHDPQEDNGQPEEDTYSVNATRQNIDIILDNLFNNNTTFVIDSSYVQHGDDTDDNDSDYNSDDIDSDDSDSGNDSYSGNDSDSGNDSESDDSDSDDSDSGNDSNDVDEE